VPCCAVLPSGAPTSLPHGCVLAGRDDAWSRRCGGPFATLLSAAVAGGRLGAPPGRDIGSPHQVRASIARIDGERHGGGRLPESRESASERRAPIGMKATVAERSAGHRQLVRAAAAQGSASHQMRQRRPRPGRDRNDGEGAAPGARLRPLVLVRSRHVIDSLSASALMGRPFGSLWKSRKCRPCWRACRAIGLSKRQRVASVGLDESERSVRVEPRGSLGVWEEARAILGSRVACSSCVQAGGGEGLGFRRCRAGRRRVDVGRFLGCVVLGCFAVGGSQSGWCWSSAVRCSGAIGFAK
jgi:hypothetical protein